MTEKLDVFALRIETDENGNILPISKEKADAILQAFVNSDPPSRFAVCETPPDGSVLDARVVAWGLASADSVDVSSIEPGLRGHFDSVESLQFLFGKDFQVIWVDPEPADV